MKDSGEFCFIFSTSYSIQSTLKQALVCVIFDSMCMCMVLPLSALSHLICETGQDL